MIGLSPGNSVLDADPAPPPRGTAPQISVHVCCGQTAGWIKMPLGMKVGLGPGRIVLHGDPAPLPKGEQPPNFRLVFVVAKWSPISATAEQLSGITKWCTTETCQTVNGQDHRISELEHNQWR